MSKDEIGPVFIHRLDTSEPGVFVVRVNRAITQEMAKNFSDHFKASISNFAEGSQLLILGPEFEPCLMPDDETMRRLGWARIKEK